MKTAKFEDLESRQMLSAAVSSVWIIRGDTDVSNPNDVITVEVNHANNAQLQAIVNGAVVSTRLASSVTDLRVFGGRGNDVITVALGKYSGKITALINGGAGNNNITNGGENATLIGGNGNDTIYTGSGNDFVHGGAGSDSISAGNGRDQLLGDKGNDTIAGGFGKDTIIGGGGANDLQALGSHNLIIGGAGRDTIHSGDGADTLDGGGGVNVIYRRASDTLIRHKSETDTFQAAPPPTYTPLATQADLTQWWIDRAVAEYDYLFGNHPYYFPGVYETGVALAGAGDSTSTTPTGLDSSNSTVAPIHSTTNNQVANVNEADLVQTDGRYIYTLTNNTLVIVDTTTQGGPSVVSTTQLTGYVSGMYLDGSRIVLVGQDYGDSVIPFGGIACRPGLLWYAPGSTQVTTLDVTDPSNPATLSVTKLDGTLSDSRMIDGRLYVVVSDSMVHGPLPEQTGTDSDGNPIYENEAQYKARLEANPSLLTIPQSTTTANGQTTSTDLVTAPNIYVPQGASDTWMDQGDVTSIVLIDTRDAAPAFKSTTSVVGYGDTVFASEDAMYLATYDWTTDGTRILKFGLGDESVNFQASGGVDGSINDRFSMGEDNGIFEIATTTDPWFSVDDNSGDGSAGDGGAAADTPVQSSSVFTMEQDGAQLNILGSLTGLEPNESIQSVRFVGDRAFISTFHQTDPPLSIDLSDPTNPTLVGSLVVPGFSSYLQPLSDTLLMGLGQNADPNTGATDWSGVEVSLFDVSDPAHPREINSVQLNPSTDQSFADSEAEWDPHAITYIPDQHIHGCR